MPKPAPAPRPPRTGEQLNHSCHVCGAMVMPDELSIWRETDEKVWFVHGKHNPEVEHG